MNDHDTNDPGTGTGPTPPESLPQYLRDGIPKQDTDALEDLAAWVDALLAHRLAPVEDDDLPDDALATVDLGDDSGGGTWVLETVTCGKESCHCMKGGEAHGPYWYSYRYEGGKTVSEYEGKPGAVSPPGFDGPLEADSYDGPEPLLEALEADEDLGRDPTEADADDEDEADDYGRMSSAEYEYTYDPMHDLAERWGLSLDEAEVFLERVGYFDTDRYHQIAERFDPTPAPEPEPED